MCLSSLHLGGRGKGHGERREEEGGKEGRGKERRGVKSRARERICPGLPVSLKVMGKLFSVGVRAGMKEDKAWNWYYFVF